MLINILKFESREHKSSPNNVSFSNCRVSNSSISVWRHKYISCGLLHGLFYIRCGLYSKNRQDGRVGLRATSMEVSYKIP